MSPSGEPRGFAMARPREKRTGTLLSFSHQASFSSTLFFLIECTLNPRSGRIQLSTFRRPPMASCSLIIVGETRCQVKNCGEARRGEPARWSARPLVSLCVIIARKASHLRVQGDVPPTLRVQTVAYNYNSLGGKWGGIWGTTTTHTLVSSVWAALTQSRRCSSQSLRWCSAEQYLTSLHLLQTCPRTVGRAVSTLPFPLVEEEHSLPSPTGAFTENATSQSIQLHISRARTRRNVPRLRPRFSGSTAAPSRPCLGNRIISQSSVQHGLGQPDGKSKKISAAGTKSG